MPACVSGRCNHARRDAIHAVSGVKGSQMQILRDPGRVVASLSRSPFRRKFKLSAAERACLREQGLREMHAHAQRLILEKLAPSAPQDDGRQTPFRGHPVYVAQHGTATCCRRCLNKWHHIPCGRPLSPQEQHYILAVIMAWLESQAKPAARGPGQASTSAAA